MSKFLRWFLLSILIVFFSACEDKDTPIDTVVESDNKEVSISDDTKSFSYDSLHRIVKEEIASGVYIEYVYDESGNLISQQVVK